MTKIVPNTRSYYTKIKNKKENYEIYPRDSQFLSLSCHFFIYSRGNESLNFDIRRYLTVRNNRNEKRKSNNRYFLSTFSVISTSGRSNQSVQVICKTACHVVESFGPPLPVLVTEALTFIDRNATVSVSVSLDGWAWLVCGRRLLVWQCKTTIHDPKQRRTFNSQCRELILPQSDLAHRADCIAVWLTPGHQVR